MSVALLVGVLNIETKAQKRKGLKFKFDDLHLLLSLGLSWSCCLSACAGAWVVRVFCVPVCSCRLSWDPHRSGAILGAWNTALQTAWQPAEGCAGFLNSAEAFGCALGYVQAAGHISWGIVYSISAGLQYPGCRCWCAAGLLRASLILQFHFGAQIFTLCALSRDSARPSIYILCVK